MLKIAGRIRTYLKTDLRQHHMFNVFFDKIENNVPFDAEDFAAYILHKNRLREHTISLANVIITMMSNSRDAPLYSVFRL